MVTQPCYLGSLCPQLPVKLLTNAQGKEDYTYSAGDTHAYVDNHIPTVR